MNHFRYFVHKKITYYLFNDIIKCFDKKKYSFSKVRDWLQEKQIPSNKCIYVNNNKLCNKNNKAASVYLEEKYVYEKLLKQRNVAPPIVKMDDAVFRDKDGKNMNIEVRGNKTYEGLFFKGCDIERSFGCLLNMEDNDDYVVDKHFKLFSIKNKDVLFLTCLGVMKILFSVNTVKTDYFQELATRILLMVHMCKKKTDDSSCGNISTDIQLFKKSSRPIPCIYLFEVGTVGNMRQHFNLDMYNCDNDKVYKFGMSCDIVRRTGEHSKTYGRLNNNSFSLVMYSYIDLAFMCKAETKLKHSFQSMNVCLKDPKHNELVVISNDKFQFVKEIFDDVITCCSGNNKDLIKQLSDTQMNFNMYMEKKENEIKLLEQERMMEKKDYEINMLKKDNELLKLKQRNDELSYLNRIA